MSPSHRSPPARSPVPSPWDLAACLAGLVLLAGTTTASAGEAGATAEPAPAPAPGPGGFRFRDVSPRSLAIDEGDRPVLVYNHGTMSREGVPASFDRSSYVHPLFGLDGTPITDDFPRDHFHHRGLFWAWPHVGIDGKAYESWVPSSLQVRFERWTRREARPDGAVLGVENAWIAGGKKVAKEEVEIAVHPAGPTSRAIDVTLVWTAIEKPIVLRGAEGKSYGGLTLRYAPQKDATITVPSGVTKDDLAMARLEWADLTATFEGSARRSGAAVFIHPSHPDFPPTWLTRHYGCLCVGWPGVDGGTLEPGKPVRCAYRVWVHSGEASAEDLARAYREYAAGTGAERGKAGQEPGKGSPEAGKARSEPGVPGS